MRTDDLIAKLSTNIESVNHRRIAPTVGAAITIGVAASLGAMLLVLGGPP